MYAAELEEREREREEALKAVIPCQVCSRYEGGRCGRGSSPLDTDDSADD